MTVVNNEVLNKRLSILLRHIQNVREDCERLGQTLINDGEQDLGLKLIANGHIHDNSKFHGVEWSYLHGDIKEADPSNFLLAAQHHVKNNQHHPEYWSGVENMPRLYIAEMVCDLHSRSSEFGNDLNDWIKDTFCKKHKLSFRSTTYREMKDFVKMVLEPAFK